MSDLSSVGASFCVFIWTSNSHTGGKPNLESKGKKGGNLGDEEKAAGSHWEESNDPSRTVGFLIVKVAEEGGRLKTMSIMGKKNKKTLKYKTRPREGWKGDEGREAVNFRQSSHFITGWSEAKQSWTKGPSVVDPLRQCYAGVSPLTRQQWITGLSLTTMAVQLCSNPGWTCLLSGSETREVTNL